jgi:hypothetical protein
MKRALILGNTSRVLASNYACAQMQAIMCFSIRLRLVCMRASACIDGALQGRFADMGKRTSRVKLTQTSRIALIRSLLFMQAGTQPCAVLHSGTQERVNGRNVRISSLKSLLAD